MGLPALFRQKRSEQLKRRRSRRIKARHANTPCAERFCVCLLSIDCRLHGGGVGANQATTAKGPGAREEKRAEDMHIRVKKTSADQRLREI